MQHNTYDRMDDMNNGTHTRARAPANGHASLINPIIRLHMIRQQIQELSIVLLRPREDTYTPNHRVTCGAEWDRWGENGGCSEISLSSIQPARSPPFANFFFQSSSRR